MGVVFFLGNNRIIEFLGSYPDISILLTVFAVIMFLAFEYIRLDPSGRWLDHSLTIRRIAITLAVISAILIVSRFANIWTINNGA